MKACQYKKVAEVSELAHEFTASSTALEVHYHGETWIAQKAARIFSWSFDKTFKR